MTANELSRGETVLYRPRFMDFDVRAKVRRLHRDGSVTVEAQWCLDDNGNDDTRAGFLGYKYRIDPSHLRKGNN
jgi:hypothetical protein